MFVSNRSFGIASRLVLNATSRMTKLGLQQVDEETRHHVSLFVGDEEPGSAAGSPSDHDHLLLSDKREVFDGDG